MCLHSPFSDTFGAEKRWKSAGWRVMGQGVCCEVSDRAAWQICWGKTSREEHHVPVAVHTHTRQMRGLCILGARKKSLQVWGNHKEKEESGQPNQSCAVRHHSAAQRSWKGRVAAAPARQLGGREKLQR